MSDVGQIERATQNRVVRLFVERLGYQNLGNWEAREGTSNIELSLLEPYLEERGYSAAHFGKAVDALRKAAHVGAGANIYEANRAVYDLLRYGVKVQPEAGHKRDTVHLIDWEHPENNHFAVAEEVTVAGQRTKRPDLVLYVNGIAIAVIELKRSKVALSEGIRQTIGNQKPEFIRSFFSTVQLAFAGNDVEGLAYAPIDTPEKYWLRWKLPADIHEPLCTEIEEACVGVDGILDRALVQVCDKRRLLEIVHDFIVFDAGIKKTCRPNQYFGVKAAQARVAAREGGIIWHTQGSGKSLTMVWLAKWLRENQLNSRVLLITDREELDGQIHGVFEGVGEEIHRASSGSDMLRTLNTSERWLVCALVHKFRSSQPGETAEDQDADTFIEELKAHVPADFSVKGNLFVFVDEAHRTQSGKLHRAMKELLSGALFIGFTGTPLLKRDAATTIETFGSFIHTYKFDEAVQDGVVLDLRYEARTVDQELTSPENVDKWFDAKTKGMSDLARAELKKRWGTMQSLYSSASRAEAIAADIVLDLETKPRLADGRGNALLVCQSIYQACKFYETFIKMGLKGKCAVVTSYEPDASGISKEDSGEGATEKLQQYDIYRQMLADHFGLPADEAVKQIALFDQQVKERFVKHPGQMRLLIVVDKLLTGFDAPPATYLYIDKPMRDHGLFQAICRVNRLDGDDKEYGYIVDYRDLFKSLEGAITDYTGGAFEEFDENDIAGLLTDRIEQARRNLDDALEKVRALCEPVAPPKNTNQYRWYFCAPEGDDGSALKANERKRIELYKAVAGLVRAYANIANEMLEAGYSAGDAAAIKAEVAHYADVRDEVKLGAGDSLDLKQYEAGMRFLLDHYIKAGEARPIGDLGDKGLIELIVQKGAEFVHDLPENVRNDKQAVAETIINNVRRLIVDENQTNPRYYAKMSELLNALIERQREQRADYEQYLSDLVALAGQVGRGEGSGADYPHWADSAARRALIDFELPGGETGAQAVEKAILETKQDDWIGSLLKEKQVRIAVRNALPDGYERLDELMDLVKARREYG